MTCHCCCCCHCCCRAHECLSGLLLKRVLADVFLQGGLLTEAELLLQPAAGKYEQQQQSDGWALLSRLHGAVTDLIWGADLSGYWTHKPFVLQVSGLRSRLCFHGLRHSTAQHGCTVQRSASLLWALALSTSTKETTPAAV